MKNLPHFVLLDDDMFALALARKVILNYDRRAEIVSFSVAREAIAYIVPEDLSDDIMGKQEDTIFLTDLHMPEMNGFELLDQLESTFKTSAKWLNIFVLSADATPDEIRKLLSYNCVTGFYNKPLSVDHIKEIVDCIQYPL
jgi:DNA-binding NarL/FixJ family response regulator